MQCKLVTHFVSLNYSLSHYIAFDMKSPIVFVLLKVQIVTAK